MRRIFFVAVLFIWSSAFSGQIQEYHPTAKENALALKNCLEGTSAEDCQIEAQKFNPQHLYRMAEAATDKACELDSRKCDIGWYIIWDLDTQKSHSLKARSDFLRAAANCTQATSKCVAMRMTAGIDLTTEMYRYAVNACDKAIPIKIDCKSLEEENRKPRFRDVAGGLAD